MLSALFAEKVEFLVVGGYALAAHGFPRATGDMDLWIRRSPENAERVWRALHAFRAPLVNLELKDLQSRDIVFQIGAPPRRIDILTSIDAVEFDDAWGRRKEVRIEGRSVAVIGHDDLLRNKKALGRPKDLADVAWLEVAAPRRVDRDRCHNRQCFITRCSMKRLDEQMRRWSTRLRDDLNISPPESNRLATTIVKDVGMLSDDAKARIRQSSPIPMKTRVEELEAFQGWMDRVHATSEPNPFAVRAQVVYQNYVCFVYLKEACFDALRRELPTGSTAKRCCKYLTDDPVRAFRNAVAHGNWRYLTDFSGLEYLGSQGGRPDGAYGSVPGLAARPIVLAGFGALYGLQQLSYAVTSATTPRSRAAGCPIRSVYVSRCGNTSRAALTA